MDRIRCVRIFLPPDLNTFLAEIQRETRRIFAVLEEEADRFVLDGEIQPKPVEVLEFGHELEVEVAQTKIIFQSQFS